MGRNGCAPFFETTSTKGRTLYKIYLSSVFVGISFICFHRATNFPATGKYAWIGLFMAELWFSLYWVITQFIRFNPIYHQTFSDRLSQRHEQDLPGVDVFVCTADPVIEPPLMVMNTVLSVMAFNYPPEKLSVYLSDDGASELTFYSLIEASLFSKHWLPFCRNYKIEPRSPAAFFSTVPEPETEPAHGSAMAHDWRSIKKLYEEMKKRIHTAARLGQIPDKVRQEHKGFQEWKLVSSRSDHQTILQIMIDGRHSKAVDIEGEAMPTLVYLSREKRPHHHHNFKAGALNSLIRVSSKISNGSIILNVDCDMYSNNPETVRDVLCFFMDEHKGRDIAFVQFPQSFCNLTRNEIYSSSQRVFYGVELAGLDGNGGPLYVGTGCFHRRETLCGKKHDTKCDQVQLLGTKNERNVQESANVLEQTCGVLASCTYEHNTKWGKEMGVVYGFPVEDVITGFTIQCRGWKSIYYSPKDKAAFMGVAPTTLMQSLVQHKRWSEGDFQIFLSKYNPLLYGHGKISLKLQISYLFQMLWAPNCFATLYYLLVPPLSILRGISLFPKVSSPLVLPFAFVIVAKYGYSLGEFLWCGGTVQGWWNDQRMWVFQRSTSYLFGFFETLLKLLGYTNSAFVVTAKVAGEEMSARYEQEVMEFGASSRMLKVLATVALVNLFSLVGSVKKGIMEYDEEEFVEKMGVQMVLCGVVVLVNMPVYGGLFFRRDKGRIPSNVLYQSLLFASLAVFVALY